MVFSVINNVNATVVYKTNINLPPSYHDQASLYWDSFPWIFLNIFIFAFVYAIIRP